MSMFRTETFKGVFKLVVLCFMMVVVTAAIAQFMDHFMIRAQNDLVESLVFIVGILSVGLELSILGSVVMYIIKNASEKTGMPFEAFLMVFIAVLVIFIVVWVKYF